MENNTYRITLQLTTPEVEALCAAAALDLRDYRAHARYILRNQLITLGHLAPDASHPLTAHLQTAKGK